MSGVCGDLGLLHQRKKRFLQDIFRLAMAKPQRAAIENQLRGLRVIKLFAPIDLFVAVHRFTQ